MSERLFGTDGIRGRAGEGPLAPAFVERLGFFAGEFFSSVGKKRAILAVRDTRASGPSLQESLTRGFQKAGLVVADKRGCYVHYRIDARAVARFHGAVRKLLG